MPSWPSRLLSGHPTPSSDDSPSVATEPIGARSNGSSNKDARNRVNSPYGTPIDLLRVSTLQSSPYASENPTLARQARHGRSRSHPFPFVFNGGKKDHGGGDLPNEAGLGTLDDCTSRVVNGFLVDRSMMPLSRDPPQQFGKDLSTGRCMTCDSTLRWPKHLNLFRCTVCLTVNDLKPRGHQVDSLQEELNAVNSVSLELTKQIADRCLLEYLRSRLKICPDRGNGQSESALFPLTHSSDFEQLGSDFIVSRKDIDTRQPYNESRRLAMNCDTTAKSYPPDHSKLQAQSTSEYSSYQAKILEPQHFTKSARQNLRYPSKIPSPTPLPPSVEEFEWTSPHPSVAAPEQSKVDRYSCIFRPLEQYLAACFDQCNCLNASFMIPRLPKSVRSLSEGSVAAMGSVSKPEEWHDRGTVLSDVDAKTLLLGDFAENGFWWTGGRTSKLPPQKLYRQGSSSDPMSVKMSGIHWEELYEWYRTVLRIGDSWNEKWRKMIACMRPGIPAHVLADLEKKVSEDIIHARLRVQRLLLKASENLLKRPGALIKTPDQCRFLMMLLANPLLYGSGMSRTGATGRGQNSGIVKRILGLMANTSYECHRHIISWFSRATDSQFRKLVDMVGGFVTYRLTRQQGRRRDGNHNPTAGLIPAINGPGTSAQLHAALGIAGTIRPSESQTEMVSYSEDWQIKAGARVMSLLFVANNRGSVHRRHICLNGASRLASNRLGADDQYRTQNYGQVLPTSSFYNTLLDYSDLVADFEAWESRRPDRFSFCQYPIFLSIWAKIRVLEYDARRQMESLARDAWFNSIISRKAISQHLVLKVRRECLVEDSLRGVSEVVGAGQEEIKKGLRIEFFNEEGIDAGGLRKEWFLLLVREVFDPEHGLFDYDEDSQYCYFNPNSFETSDQYFLIGVVLGLAIHNSTILDVALPPFAYRKLLASAPSYGGPVITSGRVAPSFSLEDLAQYRPSLAKGLFQMLEFDGNVEETFCRDFVAEVDRYGVTIQIPLCTGGARRPVTNGNRREFVDLYVKYFLDTAVARQYEPFKRGFYTVCTGNALSLFQPEEIELLVRGSDEPMDVPSIRAVAVYENWDRRCPPETEPVVSWFWETFENASIRDQKNLLSFISGSDRIPAMGATTLVIKIVCLGEDTNRFPTARTCFNMVGLYRYCTKAKFEMKLWRAVTESTGFGLK